ncbi:MAG TPA: hypothetical protein VHF25_10150 [Nitriliruptorales bacterium]|nr:hypothetical protein [Nitriliruptorales bacterium]
MTDLERRPAFYAAGSGGWRDWWTLLHPPYTLWHLSYVALGAGLAPRLDAGRLVASLVAFFLGLGVAAHALDELNGRPLRTKIPARALVVASVVSLSGAVAIGVVMLVRVAQDAAFVAGAVALIAVGVVLVVGYNLELFGGRIHTRAGFAAAWGAFPVVTAYYAQAEGLALPAALGAAAAFALSWAQRALSTPARYVRRRSAGVEVHVRHPDGDSTRRFDERFLLAPIEDALRALSWGMVLVGSALVAARLVTG